MPANYPMPRSLRSQNGTADSSPGSANRARHHSIDGWKNRVSAYDACTDLLDAHGLWDARDSPYPAPATNLLDQ